MSTLLDSRFARTPLILRDAVHDAGNVVAAAPPGGFIYVNNKQAARQAERKIMPWVEETGGGCSLTAC